VTTTSFPNIKVKTFSEFLGPEASVCGTRLRVRHVVKVYRALNEDPAAVAEYYQLDLALVNEALEYARLHSDEIEAAIREDEMFTEEYMREHYPEIFSHPSNEARPR
jgi:uncharacterized protein (DUF433 family)